MKSTKLRKSLFSLLLVLMALVITMSAFVPVAAAAKGGDLDKATLQSLDKFYSKLPRNGYGYIMAADLNAQLGSANKPFVVDVRSASDFAKGHVPGAVNIPFPTLLNNLDKLPAKNQPIVVYCGIGHNGAIVMTSLSLLGYKNVKSVIFGYTGWNDGTRPLQTGTAPAAVAGRAPSVDKKMLATLRRFFSSELSQPDFGYIMPADLNAQLGAASKPFVVDVRSASDFAKGHVPGAVNIPLITLLDNLDKLPAKNQPIVTYCAVGHNGAIAMTSLSLLGYTNVKSVVGGFAWWAAAVPKLPVVK